MAFTPTGRRDGRGDAVAAEVRDYYRAIAEVYDLELACRGDEAFWRGLGLNYRHGRILELGAGSGRVTALLAEHGAHVTALDLSPDMLRRAAARLGATGRVNVELVEADMRTARLGTRFDLVVAVDDPFSHLTEDADRDAALGVVARHLKADGCFVLDALWLPPTEIARATSPEGRRDERYVVAGGRALRVHEVWYCDPATRRCRARYEYHRPRRDPVVAEFEARYWTLDELRGRFRRACLRLDALSGSYEGEDWDETAERLIVRARPRQVPPLGRAERQARRAADRSGKAARIAV